MCLDYLHASPCGVRDQAGPSPLRVMVARTPVLSPRSDGRPVNPLANDEGLRVVAPQLLSSVRAFVTYSPFGKSSGSSAPRLSLYDGSAR